MARKRRRRRRTSRKASISQVKSIVKKEVGKTRESLRLVSYVSWSRMNDILVASGPGLADYVCCYSLTGGLSPYQDTTQDPDANTNKNLFVLRPAVTTAAAAGQEVSQYGDGGMQSQMSGVGGISTNELSNIHNLEGKQCFLKKFYCRVGLNNAVSTTQTTPSNCFVRCIVIETRRPLSSKALSQQILLQSHGVPSRGGVTPSQYPTTALGYLNSEVIKKVYYDRLINLNGGAGATGSMRSFKLKININKKAHWKYYYDTRVPVDVNHIVNYQGPFLYLLMWPSQSGAYGADFDPAGIPEAQLPSFALSSILTFMDD